MSSTLPGTFTAVGAVMSLTILIVLVLLLAVQYEFAQYLPGERARRLRGLVLIGLIPLLITFSMVVVVKIVQILSKS